jgi:2-polyprenyl-3-methyl-5-hydroxy-6-metoxy-1,4-benzoquinol methylase
MRRGGQSDSEILHAKRLLYAGAENVWGWSTAAGQERVKARVHWLKQVCKLGPGVKVIECGCGTGVFTRLLAETEALITAVDISDDLLAEARRLCLAKNVTFVRSNLEDPNELENNAFNSLCGVSVLHHLDLHKALKALKNKLKPGSRFAFSEPNLINPINRYIFSDHPEKRERLGVSPSEMAFRPKELRAIFEESGYLVHTLQHRDFLHPSIPNGLIPIFKTAQFFAERTPILRRWSGSLWISGMSH